MSERLTEIVAAKVEAAIEALAVPQVVKDSIAWDLVPAISPGAFQFLIVMCVPVPGTPDKALRLEPPALDPDVDQETVNQVVRVKLSEVQQDADRLALQAAIPQNGHSKTTPGGLHIAN